MENRDHEFSRDCPVCGRLQHGDQMAGPGSIAYWHADGSPDNCGPRSVDTHLILKKMEFGFYDDPESITAEIETPKGIFHGRLYRKQPCEAAEALQTSQADIDIERFNRKASEIRASIQTRIRLARPSASDRGPATQAAIDDQLVDFLAEALCRIDRIEERA